VTRTRKPKELAESDLAKARREAGLPEGPLLAPRPVIPDPAYLPPGVTTAADAPPLPEVWRQSVRTLRIVEEDGLGGAGRTSEILLDPSFSAWLTIETSVPDRAQPWLTEKVQARIGLHSVHALELVDAGPDAA
jgi:hypothetical protein